MSTSKVLGAVVVIAVVLVGGYYLYTHKQSPAPVSDNSNQQSNSSDQPQNSTPPANSNAPADNAGANDAAAGDMNLATLSIGHSTSLGEFLTASNGMTLYAYSKDTADHSNCTGTCLTNWPPYTVASISDLTAIDGVNGKMGTITSTSGKLQVTYNHQPLYYFVQDKQAGDVNGQNIGGFAVVAP